MGPHRCQSGIRLQCPSYCLVDTRGKCWLTPSKYLRCWQKQKKGKHTPTNISKFSCRIGIGQNSGDAACSRKTMEEIPWVFEFERCRIIVAWSRRRPAYTKHRIANHQRAQQNIFIHLEYWPVDSQMQVWDRIEEEQSSFMPSEENLRFVIHYRR